MPLIKNIRANELVGNAVVMNLADVRREADRMIEEAQAEADRIRAEARAEAEVLVAGAAERGHAEGYARGEMEGLESGRTAGRAEGAASAEEAHSTQLAALCQGWSESLESIRAAREGLREEARRDLLRLAIAISERVLGRLPAYDPTLVVGQVDAAIEMLAGATRLRIRINPDDLSIVERHLGDAARAIADASDIDLSLETDPAVLPGGCVVSAGDGEIDARLDAQMGRIVRGLFPELVDDVEDAPVAEGPAEAGEGDGPSGEVPG